MIQTYPNKETALKVADANGYIVKEVSAGIIKILDRNMSSSIMFYDEEHNG